MKSHRIPAAALLLLSTLAACSQSPTGSDPQLQPGGASFDGGGYTIGSGRTSDESGGYTIGSGTSTQDTGGFGMGGGREDDGSTSTTTTEDAERGGYTIGSGG
jgi:hypothetical protein